MTGVKLTQAVCDQLHLTRQEIIERILTGKMKGEVLEKTVMVDDSELHSKPPSSITTFPQSSNGDSEDKLPEVEVKPPPPPEPKPLSTPPLTVMPVKQSANEKRQEILDRIELTKAETLKIRAEIDYALAVGERDKPAKLQERELALDAREKSILATETGLKAQQSEINRNDAEFTAKLNDLNRQKNSISSLMAEGDKYAKEKRDEADKYFELKVSEGKKLMIAKNEEAKALWESKQLDLINLDGEIGIRRGTISAQNDKIREYPKRIAPYKQALASMIQVANEASTYHYNQADVTKGQTSDYHAQRSGDLWKLKQGLEGLLKWLTTV